METRPLLPMGASRYGAVWRENGSDSPSEISEESMKQIARDNSPEDNRQLVSIFNRNVEIYAADYQLSLASRCIPVKLRPFAASIVLAANKLSSGIRQCMNPKWLLTAAAGGASLLVLGSVVTMSGLAGGLSSETLLPNIVAGAAASQTGIMVGLGGAITLSILGGTLYGCWQTCHFLCRSPESRFLQGYKWAFQESVNIRKEECSNLGPLPKEKVSRLNYLEEFMARRGPECTRILQGRNMSDKELEAYGFKLQTA